MKSNSGFSLQASFLKRLSCGPGAMTEMAQLLSYERQGDEIVAAGQLFHTGTRVVLWLDPPNYDAYRARCRFDPEKVMPRSPESRDDPNRYSERRPPARQVE